MKKEIKIFATTPNFKVKGIPVQPMTAIECHNALRTIREFPRAEPSHKVYSIYGCLFDVQRRILRKNDVEYGIIKNNGKESCGIVLHFNEDEKDSLEQMLGLHKN